MIHECHKYSKKGYKYGFDGYCHLYNPDDEKSRINALKRAIREGNIIEGRVKTKGLFSWLGI